MAAEELPTPDLLRQLLHYDEATGLLTWQPRPVEMFRGKKYSAEGLARSWNSKNAGKHPGTSRPDGYLCLRIFDRLHLAHCVAWAIHYGQWPADQIDHLDHDRKNNAISNLRLVSHRENGVNQKLRSTNRSGICGVSWDNKSRRWFACIKVHGKTIDLGRFKSKDEAAAARRAANLRYGFHKNHGART